MRRPSSHRTKVEVCLEIAIVVLSIMTIVVLTGCAPERRRYPGPTASHTQPAETGGDEDEDQRQAGGDNGECADGEVRACKVDLGLQGKVHSCFAGLQTCQNKTWGPCAEADKAGEPSPPPPKTGPRDERDPPREPRERDGPFARSLSAPFPCLDNPCDPSCIQYTEAPAEGITAVGVPSADWETGSLADLPGGLLDKGQNEPCGQGIDCQFDQVCKNPQSGACEHSKCLVAAASGLVPGCDGCVDAICAADPSCCRTVVGPSCAHNLCTTGGPVKKTCDPCAQAICQNPAYASCCAQNGQWTAACVSRVATVCGKTCSAGSWSPGCVSKVETVCGAVCPAPNAPAMPEGGCEPWQAESTYDQCAGMDLTLGVACLSGGKTVFPACNRGSVAAPAGAPIVIFPANSGKIPSLDPKLVNGKLCFTEEPILPGECINVSSCGDLNGNTEIMINPPSLAGALAECHHDNNWTITPSDPGMCGDPCPGGSCPPVYGSLTFTETYEALCPPGTAPSWSHFMYSTTAPADSKVSFEIETGLDSSFGGAQKVVAAVAEASAGTEDCGPSGPSGCPIDLYSLLGGAPEAQKPNLRLIATLSPSTDALSAPSLWGWTITYSCPDAE